MQLLATLILDTWKAANSYHGSGRNFSKGASEFYNIVVTLYIMVFTLTMNNNANLPKPNLGIVKMTKTF